MSLRRVVRTCAAAGRRLHGLRPILTSACGPRVASFKQRRDVAMRTVFGICGLMVLTVLPVDGGEPLRLAVTPAQSFAPATVRIRARIEPSAENRTLTVVA